MQDRLMDETQESISEAKAKLEAIAALKLGGGPDLHDEIKRLRERQNRLEHERAARRAMKRGR